MLNSAVLLKALGLKCSVSVEKLITLQGAESGVTRAF